MPDRNGTLFSHLKASDRPFASGGLRDFSPYRDLGIAEATHGQVIAHLVKANMAPDRASELGVQLVDFVRLGLRC